MQKKRILKGIVIALPLIFVVGITYIVGSSYFEHRRLVEKEKGREARPWSLWPDMEPPHRCMISRFSCLAFISAENEEDWWRRSITSYAEALGGESTILDGGHYIHLDFPGLIAERSREFIEE